MTMHKTLHLEMKLTYNILNEKKGEDLPSLRM